MLDAGVPIVKCLSTLSMTSPGKMRSVIQILISATEKGMTLSEGMKLCVGSFPKVDIDSLSICERSGALDHGLNALSDYHSRMASARTKIISSSMYPLFLLVSGVFICRLPDVVLGVMGRTPYTFLNYLRDTVGLLIGLSLFCYAIFWLFRVGFKTPGLNLKLDKFIRMIPVFGKFQMDYTLSRWVESIRLMLNAGYGVVEALDVATPLSASPMIAHAYEKARPLINNPMSVSEAFAETGLFRPILIQLWSTGEESGRMDQMLDSLSAHFQEEWQRSLDNLTAWIPKILYGIIMLVLSFQILKMGGEIVQNTTREME